MKTPQEWIDENSQSGALDLIDSTSDAVELIERIQKDAIEHLHNNDMPESEIWMDMYTEMREKWLEARKHLRAANKGAERNAQALALATARYWDCRDSDRNDKQHDEYKHKTVVWNWLLMSDDEYRLKCGELSSQDLRNIRAVLKAMLGTSLIKHL